MCFRLLRPFSSPSVVGVQGRFQRGLAGLLNFSTLLYLPDVLLAGSFVRPVSAANAISPEEFTDKWLRQQSASLLILLLNWLLQCQPRALHGHLIWKYFGLAICRWLPLRQRQSETTSLPSKYFIKFGLPQIWERVWLTMDFLTYIYVFTQFICKFKNTWKAWKTFLLLMLVFYNFVKWMIYWAPWAILTSCQAFSLQHLILFPPRPCEVSIIVFFLGK